MKKVLFVGSLLAIVGLQATAQVKKGVKKPGAATAVAAKPKPSTLKNNVDSFSYAIGMNVGNNLKAQGIDQINGAAMSKAINDVFKSQGLELNDQAANQVIQQKLQASQAKVQAEQGKSVQLIKDQCNSFLAKNKARKEVITLPDGLQYEVVKAGDPNGPMPTIQDTVVAHYKGTLIDGKQFDNSYERGQPLTIPVGGVIPGWTEILQKMHVGDKYIVYIPSNLGYGDRGAGADIPGGSTLIFEMELLEIKKAGGAPATVDK